MFILNFLSLKGSWVMTARNFHLENYVEYFQETMNMPLEIQLLLEL